MLTSNINLFTQNNQNIDKATEFQIRLEQIAKKQLEKLDAAFIIYDSKNDQYARYNPDRCQKAYPPCSTFKIANALIAVETGVANGPEFMIPFDSSKTPPQPWWAEFGWVGDQTLRSAMKKSVVWYYQEIARRIGPDRMNHFLDVLNYGNRDISGGIDQFWLMSSLLISPDEQMEFLRRFYSREYKLSKRTYQTVKNILLFDEKAGYRIYAKTGGGTFPDGKGLGWFIGFVECPENVFFFVLNLEDISFTELRKKRIDMTLAILKELGVLDSKK
jgi:beta-lactamase class D